MENTDNPLDTPKISHDTLLEELKNLNKDLKHELDTTQTPSMSGQTMFPPPSSEKMELTDDNLSDFIYESAASLIKTSLDTINCIKDDVARAVSARELEAFSQLVNATTAAINTLNDINIEKRKAKTAKTLKKMDIESKKVIAENKKPNQTNVLVATREDIMKMIKDHERGSKDTLDTTTIDANFEEKPKE